MLHDVHLSALRLLSLDGSCQYENETEVCCERNLLKNGLVIKKLAIFSFYFFYENIFLFIFYFHAYVFYFEGLSVVYGVVCTQVAVYTLSIKGVHTQLYTAIP